MENQIPEKDLVVGHLYRVHARNLEGPSVYIGNGKFLGIREKFGHRFTECEYLDAKSHQPYNTCTPLEDLGPIPSDIELRAHEPDCDEKTGRPVAFDRPIKDGGRGWYFTDTGEASTEIRAVLKEYEKMYDYLESVCR